jgi:hypothetical protein
MTTIFKWETRSVAPDARTGTAQRKLAHWNDERLAPALSANRPKRALMRLQCGAKCFERYRSEFW